MSYLTGQDIAEIKDNVRLLSIADVDDVSHYFFDSHIDEYNDFLQVAEKFYELNISKTFLLIHKKTGELLAYMTLSADSIKLSTEEKELHDIAKVPYGALPALKVGKLAVNKELSEQVRRKGYGSFMLEMARAFAFRMNELGVACRFVTVDADIDYELDTPEFYRKNGFTENLKYKKKKDSHTISMRKDIFVEE